MQYEYLMKVIFFAISETANVYIIVLLKSHFYG